MANAPVRDILIVGSVPLRDAETVMRTLSAALGPRVRRLTDGETGERLRWIDSQTALFDAHALFRRAPDDWGVATDWRNAAGHGQWKNPGWHMLRPGIDAARVTFGALGYARAAIESYLVFARLKRDGAIHRECRFQVSLPTPYNVIDQRIVPQQRLAIEPAYEQRLLAEIGEMAAAIPHAELAIQWDVAHEVENLDGARPHWFDDPERGIVERLVRLGEQIPTAIELGYHLCYGDFGHRHIVEPKDMGLMVRVTNALWRAAHRPIHWIHLPVPRNRNDEAYFAPLRELKLGPETRLYLGLVHFTDALLGTSARLATARKFASDFGIATECGFGRRAPETIPDLLRLHREVADLPA